MASWGATAWRGSLAGPAAHSLRVHRPERGVERQAAVEQPSCSGKEPSQLRGHPERPRRNRAGKYHGASRAGGRSRSTTLRFGARSSGSAAVAPLLRLDSPRAAPKPRCTRAINWRTGMGWGRNLQRLALGALIEDDFDTATLGNAEHA